MTRPATLSPETRALMDTAAAAAVASLGPALAPALRVSFQARQVRVADLASTATVRGRVITPLEAHLATLRTLADVDAVDPFAPRDTREHRVSEPCPFAEAAHYQAQERREHAARVERLRPGKAQRRVARIVELTGVKQSEFDARVEYLVELHGAPIHAVIGPHEGRDVSMLRAVEYVTLGVVGLYPADARGVPYDYDRRVAPLCDRGVRCALARLGYDVEDPEGLTGEPTGTVTAIERLPRVTREGGGAA